MKPPFQYRNESNSRTSLLNLQRVVCDDQEDLYYNQNMQSVSALPFRVDVDFVSDEEMFFSLFSIEVCLQSSDLLHSNTNCPLWSKKYPRWENFTTHTWDITFLGINERYWTVMLQTAQSMIVHNAPNRYISVNRVLTAYDWVSIPWISHIAFDKERRDQVESIQREKRESRALMKTTKTQYTQPNSKLTPVNMTTYLSGKWRHRWFRQTCLNVWVHSLPAKQATSWKDVFCVVYDSSTPWPSSSCRMHAKKSQLVSAKQAVICMQSGGQRVFFSWFWLRFFFRTEILFDSIVALNIENLCSQSTDRISKKTSRSMSWSSVSVCGGWITKLPRVCYARTRTNSTPPFPSSAVLQD